MLLFQEPVQKIDSAIILNFAEFGQGLYLPSLFIVEKKHAGFGKYLAPATKKNLPGYNLELTDFYKKIFNLVEKLSPQKLALKFNPNPRKPQILDNILSDKILKKSVEKYVHTEIDKLLIFAQENDLPLSFNLPRNGNAPDFLIKFSDKKTEPLLFFKKTEAGISYRLKMKISEEIWKIQNKKVLPITNHPAWILVENQLFQIENFGGKMITPFLKKPEVEIPQKHIKTYFQTFILRHAANLDIETEGFGVLKNQTLQGCELKLTKDIFSEKLGISVQFIYPEATFQWNDPIAKKTALDFDKNSEDFSIRQTIRNEKSELIFIEKLKQNGLRTNNSNLFQLTEKQDDKLALPEWLRRNGATLQDAGFTLKNIQIGERKIIDAEPIILENVEKNIDWFDVFIEIKVGSFQIPFSNLIENIRSGNRYYRLPGGMYFIIKEEWLSKFDFLIKFGKSIGAAHRLSKNHYEVLRLLKIENQELVLPEKSDEELPIFEPSKNLKATLRPYQMKGVNWLLSHYQKSTGACLADDMGLGKTLQTIAILLHAKEQKSTPLNALIILPASLVFNWENELTKFAPSLKFYRHTGSKRNKDHRLFLRNDIALTTYQTALNDAEILSKVDFEFIVLDEGQYIKNSSSKVFKAISQFKSKYRISLSGTPIENSLSDLWSQMEFINSGHLGSATFFKKEFIYPIEKLENEKRKTQLRTLVSPFLLRRKKEEVAKDLPDLETQIFYSEMLPEQKKIYEEEKSKARNALLENYNASDFEYQGLVLRTLLKLRQLVNHPKLVSEDSEVESGKFKNILEQFDLIKNAGHKVLMFSSFTKYLDLFESDFLKTNHAFSRLTGKTRPAKRAEEVKNFQTIDDIQAFLISTKAGGTGLNLTAADYVFLMDPWWNPAAENQAIARAHRIGQTKKVIAVKFITKDSIEEKILALQEKKSALADDILEGNKKSVFSKGDLEFLLE